MINLSCFYYISSLYSYHRSHNMALSALPDKGVCFLTNDRLSLAVLAHLRPRSRTVLVDIIDDSVHAFVADHGLYRIHE